MGVRIRWASLICLLICSGCGRESRTLSETKHDLTCIVLHYHQFHSDRGRGPHNAEELLGYEDPAADSVPGNAESQKRARDALRSGKYVVIWDVELLVPAEKNAGKILAYYSDVPQKGGVVCYQDGVAAELTREQFQQTPKSQPADVRKD